MSTPHSHCCQAHSRLMCIAMETVFQIFCFLILFCLHKQAFPSCNTSGNVSKILSQNEGSFLNITYLLNVSKNTVYGNASQPHFNVCQNNTKSTLCKFTWSEESQNFIVRYYDEGDDTLCVPELCSSTSSVMTWEIKISQLLTRSITAIYLDIENTFLQTQTVLQIPLDVTYPPKVTNLTVDGQEGNNTHLINEGQEVKVSCSFNRGNPPAVFNLLDKNGMEMANKVDKSKIGTDSGEELLKVPLSVMCQDDWPTVRCEGNGSEGNRSVSFLVRCAPQFVDGPVTLVSSELENVTFRVKAHTTIFNECFLTPTPSQDTFILKLKCQLSGEPPHLVLKLHPDRNITQGSWKITLGNEIGFGNTTVTITEYSKSETTPKNVKSVGVLTIGLLSGGVLLAAVIAIVVIRVKIMTKEHKKETTAGTTYERREPIDTTEGPTTMIVNDIYGTNRGANNRNDVSHTYHPPHRDLSLPLTASKVPAGPSRAHHVRTREEFSSAQSDSPHNDETYGQTYLSAADVCRNKKNDSTTAYEADNTTKTTVSMEKPYPQRDANGLIYGELVFTAVSSPKVVAQHETKTEYATIAMTAVVPPRDHKK